MDKIEDAATLDDLFSTLKNLFTTSGLTFLFIAGKDVQERWGAEAAMTNQEAGSSSFITLRSAFF